jgi:hypothetical protein
MRLVGSRRSSMRSLRVGSSEMGRAGMRVTRAREMVESWNSLLYKVVSRQIISIVTAQRLLPLHLARTHNAHNAGSFTEPCSEHTIGVLEHAILQ